MLELDLVCDEPRWGDVEALAPLIEAWASAASARALSELGEAGACLAVLNLADDAEVRELNRQFRGQDKPTNVLSFPSGEDWPEAADEADAALHLGDIIIAFETVEREAQEQEKPFRHHLAHLVVHGILHLYGFDHIDDAEAEEMEQLERDILAQFGIPSPYEAAPINGM